MTPYAEMHLHRPYGTSPRGVLLTSDEEISGTPPLKFQRIENRRKDRQMIRGFGIGSCQVSFQNVRLCLPKSHRSAGCWLT